MIEAHFEAGDDAALVLTGPGAAPATAALRGRRARVEGTVGSSAVGWTARIPLRVSRWGGPRLPLPSGEYRVTITDAAGRSLDVSPAVGPVGLGAIRAELAEGAVTIGAPVDAAYDSGEGQAALELRYVGRQEPLENAVFFESFYGRNAGDNPRAIDAEIARCAPSVTRYWSVVDLSVEVPAGAVAVIEGSPEWWRARGIARLLIVNDWLRRRYVRRPGQAVLQTWHGTPLKRLALHRPGFDPRRALAVWRESRRWDVLLAQNPYSARVLRKAYAFFRRPIWVEGYPRTDALVGRDGSAAREALGIRPDERVLLYAPTWRDDRETLVDFLDLPRLAAAADAVVLVRGHSRTLLPGADEDGPRVIDVTGHPDLAALQLASDALVTDYSSVMFDYSVTGKPMYFFAPDLEHFRGELRGFYFDLAENAPGPLVRTQDELEQALTGDPAAFTDRYDRWRERFNSRDDGRAAERVVARLLDQGFIARS